MLNGDEFNLDLYITFKCKFHSISNKIHKNLCQTPRVGVEFLWNFLIDFCQQVNLPNFSLHLQGHLDGFNNIFDIHRLKY